MSLFRLLVIGLSTKVVDRKLIARLLLLGLHSHKHTNGVELDFVRSGEKSSGGASQQYRRYGQLLVPGTNTRSASGANLRVVYFWRGRVWTS